MIRLNKQFTKEEEAKEITRDYNSKYKPIFTKDLKAFNASLRNPDIGVEKYSIVFYCRNCGAKAYACWNVPANYDPLANDDIFAPRECKPIWKFGYKYLSEWPKLNSLKEEMDSFNRNAYKTECPVCHVTNLSHESGWHDASDYYFDELIERVRNSEKEKVEAEVDEKIELWNTELADTSNSNAAKLQLAQNDLNNYLMHLIHLESNIYSLSQHLKTLLYEKLQASKAVLREENSAPEVSEASLEKLKNAQSGYADSQKRMTIIQSTNDVMALPVDTINAVFSGKFCDQFIELPDLPMLPQEPTMIKVGFFNKSKAMAENERLQKEYENAVNEYNEQKRLCEEQYAAFKTQLTDAAIEEMKLQKDAVKKVEEEIEKEKESLKNRKGNAAVLQASLEQEISIAEKTIQDTIKARNELYGYNVVYGKYRDIVALTTFYDYLMAGRCTGLEGPTGAYNIYEQEIRTNMIISQLSAVIDNLEAIKASQYLLYTEMQNATNELTAINEKMDSAVSSLENIDYQTKEMEYNTKVSAYYAKKNAELTDALGYMVAFK